MPQPPMGAARPNYAELAAKDYLGGQAPAPGAQGQSPDQVGQLLNQALQITVSSPNQEAFIPQWLAAYSMIKQLAGESPEGPQGPQGPQGPPQGPGMMPQGPMG